MSEDLWKKQRLTEIEDDVWIVLSLHEWGKKLPRELSPVRRTNGRYITTLIDREGVVLLSMDRYEFLNEEIARLITKNNDLLRQNEELRNETA